MIEDILVNGPPWRTRVAIRLHDFAPGLDGTDAYTNRAIALLELRWGRLIVWEDYEDTQRSAEWDAQRDLMATARGSSANRYAATRTHPGHSDKRAGVTADVAADHRCIVPTLPMRAHRHPMHADADLSLPGIANLVAELLERLDLAHVTVVGNDTGGVLVQLLARARNPRISGSAASCSSPAKRSTTSHPASPGRPSRWPANSRPACSGCSSNSCGCAPSEGCPSPSAGSPSAATPPRHDGSNHCFGSPASDATPSACCAPSQPNPTSCSRLPRISRGSTSPPN